MVNTTPTKALLTTTLRPLVVQLSGPLAQGVRLVEQFLHDEPTPQKMATEDGHGRWPRLSGRCAGYCVRLADGLWDGS